MPQTYCQLQNPILISTQASKSIRLSVDGIGLIISYWIGFVRAIFSLKVPRNKDGSFFDNGQIRQELREFGYWPTDLDSENYEEADFCRYFSEKAKLVLSRMPSSSNEQTEKKNRAEKSIIFSSQITNNFTQFMITRETEGVIMFRLSNDKIEFLQNGCERLISDFGLTGMRRWLTRYKLIGKIEVYEHGLEASTIKGNIVKSKLRYAISHSKKDLVFGSLSLLLASITIVIIYSNIFINYEELRKHFDRFSTAMITTFVISIYSIIHIAVTATPPIHWTTHYEEDYV